MKRKSNTILTNKIVIICIALSFFAAIIKVFSIAIKDNIDGLNLSEFANSRNTVKETLYAKRGTIYDVNGDTLAQSVNSYTLIAYLSESRTKDENNPQHVVDIEKTAAELSPLINVSEERITKLLGNKLYQIELKRGVSELLKEQILALDLPGIDFIETNKRWYQMGNFASYIIGYAQTDENGKIIGKMGIESYYNDLLTGTDGYMEYQKDAYGYKMPQQNPIIMNSESGKDIYLTIDNNIQLFVENAVKKITNDNKMTWLTLSIMDAKTGAIVAVGSSPNFNLNTLENIESYLNPLTAYSYEPGSTMKIFSFMSAIENGIYDGTKTYQSGTIRVDNALIKDFNEKGWGVISYDQGFANSSNVAATNLALELGRDKLRKTYEDLGFGSVTGIELPGEVKGKISFNYKSEIATASFGQGITTTPVQTLQALSSLTNEGTIIKPYIVDKIVDENGNIVMQGKRTEVRKVVSKETTEKVKKLMYKAVYDGVTDAKFFQTDDITMIGKTGTAQIASGNGGYLTGSYDYIKSFAGIFPYEDPQYIIYVSTKQLVGSFRSVANMVNEIVEEIAKYKNITEAIEEIDNTKIVLLDNLISTDLESTKEKLEKAHLNPIVIGTGKYVINQYPLKGSKVQKGNKVFLVTNSDEYIMPNTKGWSSSDIIMFCNIIGLKYKLDGYGKVVSTNLEPGTKIDKNIILEITLSKDN